jgi:3,4-dihydroxy 2-butanone 4-phosphate synthase/GTP cyclohydrolase II
MASVDATIAAIRSGGMVVVVDSPDDENEGNLVMAAAKVTPDCINFLATQARGLVTVSLTEERLAALEIPPMVASSSDPLAKAFHVTVDHRTRTSSGISATDRAETIRGLIDPQARPESFRRPGHTLPIAARAGGVLKRAGHAEAAVDLAVLAGLPAAGVMCEIADEDGELARMASLKEFAARHRLPIVAVTDLIRYRRAKLARARIVPCGRALLPTELGEFAATAYRDAASGVEHMALVHGAPRGGDLPLVRVHSECLTGDLFESRRCDCGEQLHASLRRIVAAGYGALIYLRGQEGRGIGLGEKLRTYELQDHGLDTVEANLVLGHPVDAREYGAAAEILRDLGMSEVRLLTNNVEKRLGLEDHGIAVHARVGIETVPHGDNVRYLETKRIRLGHLLEQQATPATGF